MEGWDIIDEFDRSVIINASWPNDRGIFWVQDPDPDAWYAMAFVLCDCEGDAVESMASLNGREGDDDAIIVRLASSAEHEEVLARVKAWLAAL